MLGFDDRQKVGGEIADGSLAAPAAAGGLRKRARIFELGRDDRDAMRIP